MSDMKAKAELHAMLAEAVRNTQPQPQPAPVRDPQPTPKRNTRTRRSPKRTAKNKKVRSGRAGTVLPSDAGNAIPRTMVAESPQSGGHETI